jgi:homoserine O-acetyltransferase
MTEAPRFLRPVTTPSANVGMAVTFETPLPLDCGRSLAPSPSTMTGKLNAAKSNAVLICHALTGDQFVASDHPITGKPGWWTTMIGPGKPIDTDRFFVICANVIGGCMGSTGPPKTDPATASPMA